MPVPDEVAEFCRREYPRLVGSLGLFCGDAAAAEDLAQETLIKVCLHWGRVREMDAPGLWAHRVGLNLARSRGRRLGAERRALQKIDQAAAPAIAEAVSDAVTIRAAIRRLPPRQRSALIARYWLGCSVDEASAMLGWSQSSIKSLTARALASLRMELGSRPDNETGERSRV